MKNLILTGVLGSTLFVGTSSFAHETPLETSAEEFAVTPPATPQMTPFYLECMKNGGTPGHASKPETLQEFYMGPKYLFHIWTPPTGKAIQSGIVVNYFVPSSRSPNLKVEVNRKLQPGESMALTTDKFSIKSNAVSGFNGAQEFCIRQQPLIDLSGLEALTGLSKQ